MANGTFSSALIYCKFKVMQVIFYILLNILRDNSPEHACDFGIVRNMKIISCFRLREDFRGWIYFRRWSVPVTHD